MKRAAPKQKPAKPTKLKELPCSDPELTGPEVVAKLSLTQVQKRIEQAGEKYEILKQKYHDLEQKRENGVFNFSDDECSSEEETKEQPTQNKDDYEKKRRKRTQEDIEREALALGDLYGVLGLEDKTYEAGESEIRKAYQKAALKYHPDKLGDAYTEELKAKWLKIQLAYDTLSDPIKRRKYDSSLPFDEKIPQVGDFTDETFYEVFREAFNKNARFAKKKPVPSMGDDSTPMKEVRQFYAYWDTFQTWREFSQYDEYNTEEAQDRYERRYMENENKKIRSKYVQKERARLIKLYETAYNNDPRIRKENEAIEAERQKRKAEQKEQRVKAAKEREAALQALQDKKAAEEQAKQDAEIAEKNAARERALNFKSRVKELIELCEAKLPGTNYDKFWVESIIKRFSTVEKLQPINDCLSQCESPDQFISWVTQFLMTEKERQEAQLQAEKQEQQETIKADAGWSKEEIQLLTKGIVKFPPGVKNRWEQIADFVGKTHKEVIRKAQEIAKKRELDADAKKEIAERKKVEEIQRDIERSKPTTVKVPKPMPEPVQQEASGWSNEQQKQMENGMKQVPGSVPAKERWIKIAEYVEGKSPKECFERYKEIVAKLKASKQ